MNKNIGRSIEQLHHFHCADCAKWWTVGDAPKEKIEWYCPWCGFKNEYLKNE
jgi:hypothetical protein